MAIKQNEPVKIMRSQIKMAGYNPRKITPEAKAKLRNNLEKMGLMGGIVWNEATGNLVSGHQRLTIMDADKGYKAKNNENDYEVFVTKCNLTEEQEKSQNIFFNNQSAMGYFDEDKLKEIMEQVKFSEETGFTKKNQLQIFKDTELTDEEYAEIATQAEETTKAIHGMEKQTQSNVDANYIVLVFKNRGDKESLINNLGVELDNDRFCNGHSFLEQLYEQFKSQME